MTTATQNEMVQIIRERTFEEMARDCDVSNVASPIADHMRHLADACDIFSDGSGRDEYTVHLVDAYIGFVAAPASEVYGSNADYCASNAMQGLGEYKLRLKETAEADEILHEIRVGIHSVALNPRRAFGMLSRAGVPIGRKKFLAKN